MERWIKGIGSIVFKLSNVQVTPVINITATSASLAFGKNARNDVGLTKGITSILINLHGNDIAEEEIGTTATIFRAIKLIISGN